jgi:serine/threonine-protein kinase
MEELSPAVLAELQALAEQVRSHEAREALQTSSGWAALQRFLLQSNSQTLYPEMFESSVLSSAPCTNKTSSLAPLIPPDRYVDQGKLGLGGMGEIRRVHDPALNRSVALKIIRSERMSQSGMLERFIEEAQITAQLSHPAIVPVHELGRLPDGRFYFTMKKINGQTLSAVIRAVHGIRPDQTDWNVRRLLDAFLRVCEAIAYAHDRGVIHRDIKPSNIMLGAYGEVLVLDWGIAKVISHPDPSSRASDEPVTTDRDQASANLSMTGRINGTPIYMSPEQARGEHNEVGPRSDVYSLGVVLFEILAGYAPFSGKTQQTVLDAVRQGTRRSLPSTFHTPDGLRSICERAMAFSAADRYPDAQSFLSTLRDWLEGATRRSEALYRLQIADTLRPQAEQLRASAAALRDRARDSLSAVAPHEPEERKLPGWALEDEAHDLEKSAAMTERQYIEALQSALRQDPRLPEAHEQLATFYRRQHASAEQHQNWQTAQLHEALLASHDRGQHRAYLSGDGAVTLSTDPPGAEVMLFRYDRHRRRMRPRFIRHLGTTPLEAVPLAMGSYLLVLRAPGREAVRYPISLAREEHWHSLEPVLLPMLGSTRSQEAYVAAGPFWAGGDENAYQACPHQRVWVDGFFIQRHPTTNQQYLTFLNDLVDRDCGLEAERYAPRLPGSSPSEPGSLIYGRHPDGHFFLQPDREGHLWWPNWPVVMVNQACARAYAAWLSALTDQPWRLPRGLEREKAARGTDGRSFPWGDFADPAWACTQRSHAGNPSLVSVHRFPIDISPYGVRHLAGLVQDWCLDPFRYAPPQVPNGRLAPLLPLRKVPELIEVRGGSWMDLQQWSRPAQRFGLPPIHRSPSLGFRLVRPLGDVTLPAHPQ